VPRETGHASLVPVCIERATAVLEHAHDAGAVRTDDGDDEGSVHAVTRTRILSLRSTASATAVENVIDDKSNRSIYGGMTITYIAHADHIAAQNTQRHHP